MCRYIFFIKIFMIILILIDSIRLQFKTANYKKPNSLITIYGKTILQYLLDCLTLKNVNYVYIVYNKEYEKYHFEETLLHEFNINFKYLKLNKDTGSATETILLALDNLKNEKDCPILCIDCDSFYTNDIVSLWNGKNMVFSIKDYSDSNICSSFVDIDCNNHITKMVQKYRISINACTGAYGFESFHQLKEYCKNNVIDNKEHYTSVIINEMVKDGILFENQTIDKNYWKCAGTPLQLRLLYENFPKQLITNKIFCFDLDNTLVSYPLIKKDYDSVKPIYKNIKLLKYLKSLGNKIIIYTARRMKTYDGDVSKVIDDIGNLTKNTLSKFNIPYDEIIFGKPYADFYIDDCAINAFDNIEKEIGYYNDYIEPREKNTIKSNYTESITKESDNLFSEINYYLNIPVNIKKFFPKLISYDNVNYKYYTMEKVNGVSCTSLYVDEILTEELFLNILKCLDKIHSIKIDKINMYDNYCLKLEKRCKQINLPNTYFENFDEKYLEIYNFLQIYTLNDEGCISMIHGDPVFTNILIDIDNQIKFIDMRGKVGEINTTHGDIFYDYAKIYQSLIGYDCILQDKYVSNDYKNKFILLFENYIIQKFGRKQMNNIKMITKSLLLSLLPIHINNIEKCIKYFNLI